MTARIDTFGRQMIQAVRDVSPDGEVETQGAATAPRDSSILSPGSKHFPAPMSGKGR